ncbi:SUMF1/EgtB/PvdO family nonheme iron enzyme [Bradyrhizobium sp.]|uniref:SUMF1/EgtB/PvdO family nonheme iron enzyme n=1 Tax=Bradyrhizobium sp. TaxID=376 RepID=UPI002608B9D0|nr:SUMF1/EgtB/PvdO family nonheme iron enzyme [Bradyrhizobium sp.]
MLIALKLKAAALGAAVAGPLLAASLAPSSPPAVGGTVSLPASSFSYRVAGDFSREGRPVSAPLREVRLTGTLVVMKNQVTAAEYAHCAAEGACPRVAMPAGSQDVPMVGISWHDATAYAEWISRKTGFRYRLPTDEEWSFAAAERARDEALPLVDPADPAQAWIARYEAETARGRPAIATPQPPGTFGTNSNGLADVGGNVWEWTNSCFLRVSLDGGAERVSNVNCGVRVVEGAHRTYMTDFIRDPKVGGCAAGVPPSNLGFRLVVEGASPAVAIFQGALRLIPRG